MKKTIRDLLIEQINIGNNLALASVQAKDYQAAYEYSIRAESYQRLLQILHPTAESQDLLAIPVGQTNLCESNSSFILTATFCYVSPHVQINGMGYDAVYVQTKENHYVDPATNGFFPSAGITYANSRNNGLPISSPDLEMFGFSGKPISEKELEKMILYGQGNTRKFPKDEFPRNYGSPGDGEYKIDNGGVE